MRLSLLIAGMILSPLFLNLSAYADEPLTLKINDLYRRGETISIEGKAKPINDAFVTLRIYDPDGNVYMQEIKPDADGLFNYQFEIGNKTSGVWKVTADYSGKYAYYSRAEAYFRVIDVMDIINYPLAKVVIDGLEHSTDDEWAYSYDSKRWRASSKEGDVRVNAYYSNGILYLIFDVPDKEYNTKDFVEIGLDLDSKGEAFRAGDNVYVFRVYRDGTTQSFRLGTERANPDYHMFSGRAKEGGEMRVQVFDSDGNVDRIIDSFRDTTQVSYKGLLGIAGLEIDSEGNLYVLDSDSGTVSKFDADGKMIYTIGSLGTEPKEFIEPTGMAFDPDGNLYVADTGNARVQKLDPEGNYLGSFGSMGILSVGTTPTPISESKRFDLFNNPEDIAVGSNVYVIDRDINNVNVTGTLYIFDKEGNYKGKVDQLVRPTGVALDSEDNVYVVESGNNRILKLDSNGTLLDAWGTSGYENGEFMNPYGIAIDKENNIYVVDSGNNRIQKFDADGNFILSWGSKGSNEGQFIAPHGIFVDDSVYVVDSGNNRVEVFTPDGEFLHSIGSRGDGEGEFMLPEDVVVYDDALYVTDVLSKRVQKFDKNGKFIMQFGSEGKGNGEFRGPFGIAAEDALYVTDTFNKRVQKFDNNGKFLFQWGNADIKDELQRDEIPEGSHYTAIDIDTMQIAGILDRNVVNENGIGSYIIDSGKIWEILHIYRDEVYVKRVEYVLNDRPILSWTPDGIVVDKFGNVYIVDRENEIAKKFNPEGKLITTWGSSGSGKGEFRKPTAMDIDSEGNIYIVDTGNNRIEKFDSDGRFILTWGKNGTKAGEFNDPRGIAIDASDNVYVLDNGNHRVQKFDKDGNYITEWGSKGSKAGEFENLSTEGIAVDREGKIYVADFPGRERSTHWNAEFYIPIFRDLEHFNFYIAEGTYGDHLPLNPENIGSVERIEVKRNVWPKNSLPSMPGTWAEARIVDISSANVESEISIDAARACTNEICSELVEGKPVIAGNRVIFSVSITAKQKLPDLENKLYRIFQDLAKVKLQISENGENWLDVDSKDVLVSYDKASVNLQWIPLEGNYTVRAIYSGLFINGRSEPLNVNVKGSDTFRLDVDLKHDEEIIEGKPAKFTLTFNNDTYVNYALRIIKGNELVADLPVNNAKGSAEYKYVFKEAGMHRIQVTILGLGDSEELIPMKKIFDYTIDVKPDNMPLKINTIQKGESIKVIVKNRDTNKMNIRTIIFMLEKIDNIEYKIPSTWVSSLDMKENVIRFSSNDSTSEIMTFLIKSSSIAKSLHSVCHQVDGSTLIIHLC